MMKPLLISLMFCLVFLASCSRSTDSIGREEYGLLTGTVMDRDSFVPLAQVTVQALSAQRQTLTDSLGRFTIDSLKSGEQLLAVSRAEYLPDTLTVFVKPADTTRLEISLEVNRNFWSTPTDDASILAFRLSDALELDSSLAGRIQYRLDLARTVDHLLDTIHTMPDWELGKLLLQIPATIYNQIDIANLRFNHPSLDSLALVYGMLQIKKLPPAGDQYWVTLTLPAKYNIPLAAEEWKRIESVIQATANYTAALPEGPPWDISLTIENSLYTFYFSLNPQSFPDAPYHSWQIQVRDNEILSVEKK